MCSQCNKDLRTHALRGHNLRGESHYIESTKFEVMLEKVSF